MNESRNQTESAPETVKTETVKTETVKTESTEAGGEAAKKPGENHLDKISKEAQASEKTVDRLDEEETGQMQETVKELVKEIADALEVTDQEVISAMETLGMSFGELTNPVNLARLTTEVLEEVDGLTLVTDEALFSKVTELSNRITQTVEELAKDLGVETEELVSLMEEAAKDTLSEEQIPLKQEEVGKKTEQIPQETFEKLEVSKEKHVVQKETETNESTGKEETALETHMVKEQAKDEGLQKDKGESHSKNQTTAFFQQQTVFAEEGGDSVRFGPLDVPTTSIDPESILDQIGEMVKITNKEEYTSMEMQLHPESLGTLHLQIRAKEGVITAQFTTENEAVKQVLEAQVVQLKERLEAQGVKVEAVEVMVGSHEFERNLEKGNSNGENTYAPGKVTRRKINLNVLDDEEEADLEEEEKEALGIRRDMMQRNGSTLDYMV